MKTPRLHLQALVPVIAGVLVVAGCSENAGERAGPSPTPMAIAPRVSVGEIKAGMTAENVIAALGEPERKTANALEYTKRGFAIMPGQGVVQVVMCGDVTGLHGPLVAAFTGKTKEGLGMNSSRAEILAAYGQPDSSQSFVGGRESLRYDNLGITFGLEGGKTHHIIVRLTGDDAPVRSIEIKP